MRTLWAPVLLFVACGCGDRSAGPLIGRDGALAPRISTLSVFPDTMLSGDPFQVTYAVTATAGVAFARLVYQPTSTTRFVDSIDGHGVVSLARTVNVPSMTPPLGASGGGVVLDVVDMRGNATTTGKIFYFDPFALLGGTFTLPHPCRFQLGNCGYEFPILGDTVRFHVTATAQLDLRWVGYSIDSPVNVLDSIPVVGTTVSGDLLALVTRKWETGDLYTPTIRLWVRDIAGHRQAYLPDQCCTLYIDGPRRPVTLARLDADVPVHDVLLDTLRGVLYLTQPDSNRILRLSVATMTFGAPLSLPGLPHGIDLSLSGDSLFVTLFGTSELGIVNLVTGEVTRVHIGIPNPNVPSWYPDYVREAANGRLLIPGAVNGVIEYDLKTGRQFQRLETDWGGPVVPIGNRSRLALGSQIYSAATDTMSEAIISGTGQQSSDRAGRYFLEGTRLWTSDFTSYRDYFSEEFMNAGSGPSVLATDASFIYVSTLYGYYAIRISDGVMTEQVPVPLPSDGPMFRWIVPLLDGHTLIGVGPWGVARIDLSRLAPASHR